ASVFICGYSFLFSTTRPPKTTSATLPLSSKYHRLDLPLPFTSTLQHLIVSPSAPVRGKSNAGSNLTKTVPAENPPIPTTDSVDKIIGSNGNLPITSSKIPP